MLQVNFPVVNRIHPKGSKFVTGVMIKATGNSKLNDSPDSFQYQASLLGSG